MKPEELMLEDWVYVNGNYPHRVYSLDKDAQRIDIFSQECDIKPITLTPKILEDNGFQEKYPNSSIYRLNLDNGIVVAVGLYEPYHINISEEANTLEGISCCELLTLLRPNAKCLYVHELQHAMRMCEIPKKLII